MVPHLVLSASEPTYGLSVVYRLKLCLWGRAMPHTHQPDTPFPPHIPICPNYIKPMRLVAATPDTPFKNIKHATFECDCGFASEAMIADND